MAELGIIASILGVAQVGVYLSQKLYAVGSSAAAAPHNIHRVATNVTLFAGLLKHVANVLEGSRKLISCEAEDLVRRVVGECEVLFKEVEGMLGSAGEEDVKSGTEKPLGRSKRRLSVLRRVKWRFEQPRADWMMAQLEYLKTTLSVLIQTLNLAAVTAQVRKAEVHDLAEAERRKEEDKMRQERVHVEALVVARQLSMIVLKQFDKDEEDEEESDDSETTNKPKLLTQGLTDSAVVVKNDTAKDLLDDLSNEKDVVSPIMRHSHAIVDTLLSRWTILPPPYTDQMQGDSSPVQEMNGEELPQTRRSTDRGEETLSEQTKPSANVGLRLTESTSSMSRSSNSTSTPPPPQNTRAPQSKRSSLTVNTISSLARTTSTPEPSSAPPLYINSYVARGLDPSSTWNQPPPYMPVEPPAPDYAVARPTSQPAQSHPRSLTLPAPLPRPGHSSISSPSSTISRHNQNGPHHSRTAPSLLPHNSNYQAPFISDWESTISLSRSNSSSSSRSSSPSTPGTQRYHRRQSHGLNIPWRIRVLSSAAGIASGRYFDFVDSSIVGPHTPFLPSKEALDRIYSDSGLRATAKDPGAITEIKTAWVAEKSLRVAGWRYSIFWGAGAEPPAPLDGGYRDEREGVQGWRIQGALTVDDIEALVEHTIELHKGSQQQNQARPIQSEIRRRSERDSTTPSFASNRPQTQQQRPVSSYAHHPQQQSQQQQHHPSRLRSVSFSNNNNSSLPEQQTQNQHYQFGPMVQSPSVMGGPQSQPQNYRQSMYGNNPQSQNPYFPMQGPQQQQQYANQQNTAQMAYPPPPPNNLSQNQQQNWNYTTQPPFQQQRNSINNDSRDRERSYSPSPERRRHRSRKERREREEEKERKEDKKKKNSAAGTIARLGGLAALLEGFDAL